jgi:hypothetical protein
MNGVTTPVTLPIPWFILNHFEHVGAYDDTSTPSARGDQVNDCLWHIPC